ncbi:unnamed protein product [Chrysoparadoxa australica]
MCAEIYGRAEAHHRIGSRHECLFVARLCESKRHSAPHRNREGKQRVTQGSCQAGWVGAFCDPRMKAMGTVQLETDQQQIKKWVLDEVVVIGKERRADELASLTKLIARAKEQERVQEEQGEEEVQDSQEPAKSPSGPNLFKEMANRINLTRPVVNPSRSAVAVAVGCQPATKKGEDYEKRQKEIECEITTAAELEITQYWELVIPDLEDRFQNPLDFWRQMRISGHFPYLQGVARKFLCILPSSALSERVFSSAGALITDNRTGVDPDRVDQMMLLKGMWGPAEEFLNTRRQRDAFNKPLTLPNKR